MASVITVKLQFIPLQGLSFNCPSRHSLVQHTIMEPYEPNEVDKVSCEVCPFNEAHRLHTFLAYRAHLTSCKDQFFSGVVKLRCPYDYAHIYVSKDRLDYHKPRCESHPMRKAETERLADVEFGEVPGKLEYQQCPFYPYHGVRVHSHDPGETHYLFTHHLETCPRRFCPFKKEVPNPNEQFPLTPFQPVDCDRQTAEPGVDTAMAARIASERVIIYFRDRGFAVRRELLAGKQFTEKSLYIDATISYNTNQFPGLTLRMEKRDHVDYLLAKLLPDTADKTSTQAFYALYGGLESHNTNKMAIVYQCAGINDTIYLIVHPREPNGFGGHLSKGELGLFKLRHTELLGVPSTLDQAIRRAELFAHKQEQAIETLQEKDTTIASLTAEISTSRTHTLTRELEWKQELDRQSEENRTLKEEITTLRATSLHAFEEMKTRTLQDFDTLEKAHEEKVTYLKQSLEQEQREKSVISLNEDRQKQIVDTVTRNVNELSAQLKACEAQKLELQKRYESLLVSCESKKRANPASEVKREEEMCRNCGEYARNTVFYPCGHLYYCNMCLDAMRIPLGTSLKSVRSVDKVCPLCKEEIKKVGKAFPWKV